MSVTYLSDTEQHSAILLHNVATGYDNHVLFSELSLQIPAGGMVGIIGPTASGKTTLLKTILGMQPVLTGCVQINGHAINALPSGTIGYVPQLESIDWHFPVTVEEVIMMGLYTNGRIWPWLSKTERQAIHDLAHRLGVEDCLRQHIGEISGGQRQRTFLARALISNPRLLILDEPTSGIDIKTPHDVLHLLADIHRAGTTVVLTTHDLNAVASHLPWVICFNRGIVAQGRPHDVFTNEILSLTYGGSITIVKHKGRLLVANSHPLHFDRIHHH